MDNSYPHTIGKTTLQSDNDLVCIVYTKGIVMAIKTTYTNPISFILAYIYKHIQVRYDFYTV